MTDAPEKREVKAFEPPPWEKEAFERLLREKDRDSRPDTGPSADGGVESGQEPEPPHDASEPEAVSAVTASTVVAEDAPAAGADGPAIDLMLMALREEEPDATEGIWKVGLASGVFVGVLGLVLVVWGAVALARTLEAGPVGWMGSLILGLMGIGLVSLGLWLGGRSLRKQGVL